VSLKFDICISQANYIPVQRLADGIARAEALLEELDEAIEDEKENLNAFLIKHGVAKSAIYCRGHFGEIHEIKDLEKLEVSHSLRSTNGCLLHQLEHLKISVRLSDKFTERSGVIRKIVRKKAAQDKLMSEIAGDAVMRNNSGANRPMGDAQSVEAFVGSSSVLGSYVMDLKKDAIDQILDPEFNGYIV
jgi:hypothetical protein